MDRRTFGSLCGAGMTGLILSPWKFVRGAQFSTAQGGPLSSQVFTMDLGGTAWTLQQVGENEKLPAQVPGDHYSDLLKAKKIPNPYYRDNNEAVQWAAKTGWVYERTFNITPQQLSMKNMELVCYGLDTFATVILNDKNLGSTNNMFRTWVFDVQHILKVGSNHLQIQFQPLPDSIQIKGWLEAYIKQHPEVQTDDKHWHDSSWIRKAPYQWGWDWCRSILTMGIWKGIELRAYESRLANVAIVQHHDSDNSVRLDLKVDLVGYPPLGCLVSARLLDEGKSVKQPVTSRGAELTLSVSQPKLWWPNGLGEQNLYTLEAQLLDASGNVLDTIRKRIGLRQFETVPRGAHQAYTLKVNGQPFFAKGANLVPLDNLPAQITPQILRSYMQDAAACNFNFIRLWGGGFYEDDALFDACDELGLALMFEFKFANVDYPVFNSDFIANVKQEIEDQILRVRHHPSVAIWCGNNEIRNFVGYSELFEKVIGDSVRFLAPGQPYQSTSGGAGCPDVHDWRLGHSHQPFSHYLGTHGFVSEFGIQSYLEPSSTLNFATANDLVSGANSPMLVYHERSDQKRITDQVLGYFGKIPASVDDLFWLSQIVQSFGIRLAVEHWRRDWPHSTAALIWQYNDSWPGQTWSMIDYYHRWKALQYHAKHMFAPVLVSGDVDAAAAKVDIYVINDYHTGGKATLAWQLGGTDGKVLRHNETTIELPANCAVLSQSVVLTEAEKAFGLANLLLWMTVTPEGKSAETNISFFTLPGQLTLPKPSIRTKVEGSGKHFSVTLESAQPALWTWITLPKDPDARYSDNFMHLQAATPITIEVDCREEYSIADFQAQLTVRSVQEFIVPGLI